VPAGQLSDDRADEGQMLAGERRRDDHLRSAVQREQLSGRDLNVNKRLEPRRDHFLCVFFWNHFFILPWF
jgi:hypothetical protein